MVKKSGKKVVKKSQGNLLNLVKTKHDKQVAWVLGVIAVIILLFIGSYFYFQSLKNFEYAGVEWIKEEHGTLDIYHARFPVFYDIDANYNLYFRYDPRKSDIEIDNSNFKFFTLWSNIFIGFDKETGDCKGQLGRVKNDMISFLRGGLNTSKIYEGLTYKENGDDSAFIDCSMSLYNATVIKFEMGEKEGIFRDEEFPSCYTIVVENCDDFEPVERFMIEILSQLNKADI